MNSLSNRMVGISIVCFNVHQEPHQYNKQIYYMHIENREWRERPYSLNIWMENWIKTILMIVFMVICLNIEYQFQGLSLIVSIFNTIVQFKYKNYTKLFRRHCFGSAIVSLKLNKSGQGSQALQQQFFFFFFIFFFYYYYFHLSLCIAYSAVRFLSQFST